MAAVSSYFLAVSPSPIPQNPPYIPLPEPHSNAPEQLNIDVGALSRKPFLAFFGPGWGTTWSYLRAPRKSIIYIFCAPAQPTLRRNGKTYQATCKTENRLQKMEVKVHKVEEKQRKRDKKLGQTNKVAKAADARSKGAKCQVKALAKARLEHDKEIRCLKAISSQLLNLYP